MSSRSREAAVGILCAYTILCAAGPIHQPALRSRQSGFIDSISLYFRDRGHRFNVFSRAMAPTIFSHTSKNTSIVMPYGLVNDA
jgi:hypothetical protein